ncbi:MAG: hypothetical protein SV966_10935 [Actinomycetota bacterium]|nr:hypothetical protein [Actinomycetota bacterium]
MRVTPQLVQTLDHTYQALRAHHQDLPNAMITVETPHPAVTNRLAYYTPEQIITTGGTYDGRIVFLLPPRHRNHLPCAFTHGPETTFEVLIHESAHALAAARGIKDTSRGGTYHNKRFAALATELGLEVDGDSAKCENTAAPPALIAQYRRHIDALRDALPTPLIVNRAGR